MLTKYIWAIKAALVAAAVAAALWGLHLYNDMRRDEGREEVRAEWTQATKAQQDAFDEERKRITRKRDALADRFHQERDRRVELERQANKEREDAIRDSAVAGNVCFDERMRDQWNRDSGHAGAGAGRPGVDATMPRDPVEAGRSDRR